MYRFAMRNVLSRPGRSLLAVLGLTVAIAGMVGLFSVAEGIDSMVSDVFGRIPGLVVMEPGAPIPLFSSVPASWEEEIRRVPGVRVVTPETCSRANIIDGKPVLAPPRLLFGIDMDSRQSLRRDVYREAVREGRYLSPADRGTGSAVISRQIAREFGKSVGDTLQVNGSELRIVGIYQTGILVLDVVIVVDIERLRAMARLGSDTVCNFYLEPEEGMDEATLKGRILDHFHQRGLTMRLAAPHGDRVGSGTSLADLARQLDRALKSRPEETQPSTNSRDRGDTQGVPESDVAPSGPSRTVSPTSDVPLEIQSTTEWSARFDQLRGDLDIMLGILTAIGVTVALLSIVNTMLMNVSERVIEFGILRANGWSKRCILTLITFESSLLGLTGGLLGAAFGWVGTQVINSTWPDRARLYASVRLLLFSVVFSVVLGVLGGLYPAFRATRLSPMESIRRG